MSSKTNKAKLIKVNKSDKAINERQKIRDLKPTNISALKSMKKNSKQPNKIQKPSTNQKLLETNNFKSIHNKKRSETVKKTYPKENTRKKVNNITKTSALKKYRSKSVNEKVYKKDNKELATKKLHIIDTNQIVKHPPLTKSSSDTRYNPKQICNTIKTKSQPNFDSLYLQNKPILRTKSNITDARTQEGRKKIAKETMRIMFGPNSGKYDIYQHGILQPVDISEKISNCVKNTETIINVQYESWYPPILTEPTNCSIEIRSETPLNTARRLSTKYKTCIINFGSATKPSNSFLNGKNLQEDSLLRHSSLFKSQQKEKFMYLHHKVNKSNFKYSDYMIYSPSVPIFRDERTEKLLNEEDVFCTDIITSAAPNKDEMVKNGQNIKCLQDVLYIRCEKILRCAIDHGAKALILGDFALSCGGNDPKLMCLIFKDLLHKREYKEYFNVVVFNVNDSGSKNGKELKKKKKSKKKEV